MMPKMPNPTTKNQQSALIDNSNNQMDDPTPNDDASKPNIFMMQPLNITMECDPTHHGYATDPAH